MRTSLVILLCGVSTMHAQFDPPKVKPPDEATIKLITDRLGTLRNAVGMAVKVKPDVAPDLDIYVKAITWIVHHNEWLVNDAGKQTLAVIEQGMKRAEAAQAGQTPWLELAGKTHIRAYRSAIDGSVQPYAVWLPADYGKDPKKIYRVDIMLHGRDSTLTEVKFLNGHNGRETPKGQDFVQIDIYGRGNNAYRWAGERDVFEAFDDFKLREAQRLGRAMVDDQRVVLKGFSMGGAGTWHIGLRHPAHFAAIQPGAGFTTTHGYIAGLPNPLPAHQEACLKIYDALNYAENAAMVPIVAYSGELDKQRLAAENIEKRVKELRLTEHFTHLIGPKLEHKFPPEWQQVAEKELQRYVGEGVRRQTRDRIKYTTYTPINHSDPQLTLTQLETMYQRADIDAQCSSDTLTVTTHNVRAFTAKPTLTPKPLRKVIIDGQNVVVDYKSTLLGFKKSAGTWQAIDRQKPDNQLAKTNRVAGPIDHAFTSKFLCVIGTGTPLNSAMDQAARLQLARFQAEWHKHFRGELVVKKDTEVKLDDLPTTNIILFGDPGSNKLIAEVLPKLPLQWDTTSVRFGDTAYASASHLPMMIYPLGQRYIVLNSGHTFHDAEFRGTNAQLYPRLGDFAIVKPLMTGKDPANVEVITAGLFDENWALPKKK